MSLIHKAKDKPKRVIYRYVKLIGGDLESENTYSICPMMNGLRLFLVLYSFGIFCNICGLNKIYSKRNHIST